MNNTVNFISEARQFIFNKAGESNSPASTLLLEAHQLISALQQIDLDDPKNIELKVGMLDESIDSAIEKLQSLKSDNREDA